MTEVVIRAFRVSGYVPGPCPKCSKEERGLVMFEDYALGWECLLCGEIGRADRVEWIEGKDPALADLHDEEECSQDATRRADATAVALFAFAVHPQESPLSAALARRAESGVAASDAGTLDLPDCEGDLFVRRIGGGEGL